MILKTLTLSTLTAAILIAAVSTSPLSIGSRSTDTGGTKPAIDAYSDGAGVLVINQSSDTKVDNTAMNNLVFKYGDAAKKDGVSLTAEVKTISSVSSVQEKSLADKIGVTNYGGSAEVVAAPKLVAVPTCSDSAMTWNTTTKLCEKGVVTMYTASSSSSLIWDNCESGIGYIDQASSRCAAKGYRLPSLSETKAGGGTVPSCAGYTWTTTESGWEGPWGYEYMTYWNWSGTSTGKNAWDSDAQIRCVKSGATYTCPSGGTLSGTTCTINTLVTAPGICQTGYTLTANQCVQN